MQVGVIFLVASLALLLGGLALRLFLLGLSHAKLHAC